MGVLGACRSSCACSLIITTTGRPPYCNTPSSSRATHPKWRRFARRRRRRFARTKKAANKKQRNKKKQAKKDAKKQAERGAGAIEKIGGVLYVIGGKHGIQHISGSPMPGVINDAYASASDVEP